MLTVVLCSFAGIPSHCPWTATTARTVYSHSWQPRPVREYPTLLPLIEMFRQPRDGLWSIYQRSWSIAGYRCCWKVLASHLTDPNIPPNPGHLHNLAIVTTPPPGRPTSAYPSPFSNTRQIFRSVCAAPPRSASLAGRTFDRVKPLEQGFQSTRKTCQRAGLA